MRKSIFMFCCVLATSVFFIGCEDTEVKVNERSHEITIDDVLKYHYEMYPELAAENARTQFQQVDCQVDFTDYMGNSIFNITTSITNDDCNTGGNKFNVYWYIQKDDVMSKWFDFPIKMTCLNESVLLSDTRVTQKTTKVRLYALVYNGSSIWGVGSTDIVVLKKP